MRYSLVLVDLDDTLLDFRAAEPGALRSVVEASGITFSDEVLQAYRKINLDLWAAFERGELSKDEVSVNRFAQLLQAYDASSDPQAARQQYEAALCEQVHLIDGAEQFCAQVSAQATLGIVTNGIAHIQRPRLAASALQAHVDFMVVSEECGAPKPAPAIFDYALEQGKCTDRSQVVIIGDRLASDILGGNRYGIDSCWFNPDDKPADPDIQPTFTGRSLHAIYDFLR